MNEALLIVLMTAASYRLTRLLQKDTFPPVLWLRDRLAGGWRDMTEKEIDHVGPAMPTSNMPASTLVGFGIVGYDASDSPIRYIARWKRSPYWLAELITCPWCASGYISGAVTAATDMTTGVVAPVLVGFAVWAGSALLASKDWA